MTGESEVALVTGASRGIGRAIVEEFATAGYAVAFTYAANAGKARELVECLRSRGCKVNAYQADVRDFARAGEVVAQAQQELGPITVLVNNAGIKRDGAFASMDPGAWHDVIDTNLNGTFNYCRVLMREFIRRGGAVINVASVGGQIGVPGQANYCASKAGVIGFTKALAKEVARFGVRVNAVAPGYIDTEMTASMDENARKKLLAQIPLGKPGSARDVAGIVLFLAGGAAAYVTGQVWTMDGGVA
jgi:3-oxoacyl-[acyl-carrier protein] reductase